MCSEEEKTMFTRYFEQKVIHMHATLQRAGTTTLEVTLERFPKKSAYKVSLHATATHGKFFASEDDHTIAEAIDLAEHKLMTQIVKKLGKEKERAVRV